MNLPNLIRHYKNKSEIIRTKQLKQRDKLLKRSKSSSNSRRIETINLIQSIFKLKISNGKKKISNGKLMIYRNKFQVMNKAYPPLRNNTMQPSLSLKRLKDNLIPSRINKKIGSTKKVMNLQKRSPSSKIRLPILPNKEKNLRPTLKQP